MTVAQVISEFLRDAQYRIAQITISLKNMRKDGNDDPNYYLLQEKRRALIDFMEMIYDSHHKFVDGGYNFLAASVAWTDREIIAEAEYLRNYADMVRIPYGVFVGYYPTILNNILGDGFGGGTTLPTGDYLEILRYNVSGVLEAIPFPEYAGMGQLSIDDYFAGRT